MTRIIAGSVRGHSLKVPKKGTRPTSDKIRGAIFSRLQGWQAIEGARVLDLFAGSGALGLEALSRGAATATLVERAGPAASIIKENARSTGMTSRTTIMVRDAAKYLRANKEAFDLAFVDPPYDLGDDELAALLALLQPRLSDDALVIVERDIRSPEPILPEDLGLVDSKTWGDTRAWFIEVVRPTQSDPAADIAPRADRCTQTRTVTHLS